MHYSSKRILVVIISKSKSKVEYQKSITSRNENYDLVEFHANNILEGYSEFIKDDYAYIIVLNPDNWRRSSREITTHIVACIDAIAHTEHYAICQPSLIYGDLLPEHNLIRNQKKTHSYIRLVDDSFLLIKGAIAKNFSFSQFIEDNKMNWNKYREEINFYGFESLRLCNFILEVNKSNEFQFELNNPTDSIDLINNSYLKKTFDIGIEFSYLAPIYNGTSEYATSILKFMVEFFLKENLSFQIIADSQVIKKFNLEVYSNYLIDPAKCEENFYKVLFIPQQVYAVAALEKINRISFKFVFTMLDVIALRCRYLGEPRGLDIASSIAYKYADSVIGLSQSSSKDIESFFNERMIYKKVIPILLTKEVDLVDADSNLDDKEFDEKDYILLMGNGYKHKAVEKTLSELYNSKLKVVVIGDDSISEKYKSRFKFYTSGRISNQVMDLIYRNSSLILYPSLYEGFGLPVVASLQLGKRILVFDSIINRELKKEFDKNELIYFFDSFSNLPQTIETILKNPSPIITDVQISRKWKDVSAETNSILIANLKENIDFDLLNQRVYDVREVRKILENSHWIKLHHFKFLFKLLLEIFARKMKWYLGTIKKSVLKKMGIK